MNFPVCTVRKFCQYFYCCFFCHFLMFNHCFHSFLRFFDLFSSGPIH
ncbi:hypothetical protein [Salinivirga cyanobacteriivorans]